MATAAAAEQRSLETILVGQTKAMLGRVYDLQVRLAGACRTRGARTIFDAAEIEVADMRKKTENQTFTDEEIGKVAVQLHEVVERSTGKTLVGDKPTPASTVEDVRRIVAASASIDADINTHLARLDLVAGAGEGPTPPSPLPSMALRTLASIEFSQVRQLRSSVLPSLLSHASDVIRSADPTYEIDRAHTSELVGRMVSLALHLGYSKTLWSGIESALPGQGPGNSEMPVAIEAAAEAAAAEAAADAAAAEAVTAASTAVATVDPQDAN